MSHASIPSQPSPHVHDPAQRPAFRLSDAEKIASVRLDTMGDGSLKEALAEAGESAPRDEVEHLTSRIEQAQAAYAPPAPTSTIPVLADPPMMVSDMVDFTIPEWSDARGVMLAELHQQATAPPEAAQPTHWQPAARDTDPYAPPAETAARPEAPPSAPPMMAEPPPLPEPPLPEPPLARPDVAVPIANALDAAAKLTADATATAAALENLTRLLEKHRLATHAAAAVQPAAAQHQPQQRPAPRPTGNTGHRPPQAAHATPVPLKPRPLAAARPIKPPALRRPPLAREAQFDVRGFMAGFALSCAIGAVIYIYLIGGG